MAQPNLHKEQVVKGIFNMIAPKYDLVNNIISFGRHHYWRKFTVAHTGLHPGERALDLCCGTGMITKDLAAKVAPHGSVVGLDFSEKMLEIARKRLKCFQYNNLELVQGDAMDLPFPDNSFDCVTIGYGLRNVSDLRRVLIETKRVLKPGGTVVSVEMGKPYLPVFRELYYYYLNKWIPFTGRIFTKDPYSYRYLYDSILAYPHQNEITTIYGELAFRNTLCYELTWGVVVVHIAHK